MAHSPFTVLVTGPESSGKSTLARGLAAALSGVYVAEFAREYLEARAGVYKQADLDAISYGQLASQQRTIEQTEGPVICDTGPEVLYVWSLEKYGTISPAIDRALYETRYDSTLLCYPDLKWEPDPLREHANDEDRIRLFTTYERLTSNSPNRMIIRGSRRLEQAIDYLEQLIG